MVKVIMATQNPNENLAQRARDGDRNALGELVSKYRPRLTALVNSRLNARLIRDVEADEIIQETRLRACKSIGKFTWQGEDSFLRWLGGIAEHVMIDLIRRKVKTQTAALDAELLAEGETASKGFRRNERFDRLRQALGKLDVDQRKVVVLARLKKLPIRVIAEEMDRSPDSISQLLIRAVRKLGELMGDTESLHLPKRHIAISEFGDDR